MKKYEEGVLLRILVDESSRCQGRATVLKGVLGYGSDSMIHSTKILRLSEDLPMIVEIVDTREKVNSILPFLDENVKEGLITMENVSVIKYQHNNK